ncbi:ATP-dependent DNA helicase RecG [Fulvivirgaceae bacterium PWU4]|uniref:ATP-dependent DNA helicase RecG n=1 Tax=Chryseosolibacter histidini TaxID=2782349 RepID=A0AAP2DTJ2_9BACT|nr:ATP-dependent DNA helicase RecG [Chryseosolibacter histidini]MBT1701068.1 ATP-dependent DNA helicase RecG [Chryseosolibacter histidini]
MATRAFFDTPVEYLKGVGPQRAVLLNKELKIFTFGDLIQHYPFRYEDRTRFFLISEIEEEMPYVQIKGRITGKELIGAGVKKRLVAHFADDTGQVELTWFQGINWINEKIKTGVDYVAFGKPAKYGNRFSLAHPELEPLSARNEKESSLHPVYPLTEKLRGKHLDSKVLSKLIHELLTLAKDRIRETLPARLLSQHKFISKQDALRNIHFPQHHQALAQAQARLKFEELFYIQLRLLKMKLVRKDKFRGQVFNDASLVTKFYNDHLPFALTQAQKKVIKEIYADLRSGQQMNRLLQGDVGSGKTIVGFICMLLAAGSGAQNALMAPTEILAQQHFNNLRKHASKMQLTIELLTGSTKKSDRKRIHESLRDGSLNILIGTHALLEEEVQFRNLGLAIIDEQHRFGVAQRSKLWQKNNEAYPHVLVMTATPIPRTLAMTLYGDLDVSVIDELPAGRKPIKTVHQYDSHRLQVNQFLRNQIAAGRQVYVVYPLIDESEKLDLKHLMDGYESISRAFPDIAISIVHGKMKPEAKDYEMARFIKDETKIMVATTVIEVGVDVPNASVMVIENAERFGLSQLHQLRGRVGRGAEQSYCILITNFKLGKESRARIETMVKTNNGFEIAETDLQLRGPGDLMGTQQSGVLDLLIADLGKDGPVLQQARQSAIDVLDDDPDLQKPENSVIRTQIESSRNSTVNWSRIS